MTFGAVITRARTRQGITQRELARRIQCSAMYINDIEHGRRNPPQRHWLERLADVLNLPIDYLCFMAGAWPESINEGDYTPEQIAAAFRAFRTVLEGSEQS